LTIDTDSEWVSASCAQLERALRNIVQNAFRHARTTVEVKSAIRGNWYEITVSNDGADIPAEVQEEIFRPFVRLDSARSRDEGGSGLGLPIARDTLERHHGTLSVQSANGTTTFILKLPLPIEKINDYLNNG
jgi:signal transduction histidine kinase